MIQQPNIVFLMTDHTHARALAPDSPCLTPNLDAIAAAGRRFSRATTTNAICSPARASLMTGTYPSTHGMWDCTHTQRQTWVNVDASLPHWSENLRRAGYVNGYFGKWHVEQSKRLEDFGWDEVSIEGTCTLSVLPDTSITVPKRGYRDYFLAAQGDDTHHPTHPAFDHGIDFIRNHSRGERPFCCFVSTTEPHDPYLAPASFFSRYNLDAIPLSPSLADTLCGKPEVLRRMQSVWAGLSERDWRHVTVAYWSVISFIDREIGRLVGVLEEAGINEDTIIVFTSDHGDMLGGHGLLTKGVGTAYEEVYNIPLIVRVPGMGAGVEDECARVSLVDLGPTLLDLAGADPLPSAQGRSLRPVLEGTSDPTEWQDAYAEFFGQRFVYSQRITWHGPWKYIFSPGGIDELYDLQSDPNEMINLTNDPEHAQVLEDMCCRMWRQMESIGDDSLLNTHYATLRTAPVGPGLALGR